MDDRVYECRLDERNLRIAQIAFAFELGQEVPSPEKAFCTFVAERDFGGAFGVNPQDQSVAQIRAELHWHNLSVRTLGRKHEIDACRARFDAEPLNRGGDSLRVIVREHPLRELVVDQPNDRQTVLRRDLGVIGGKIVHAGFFEAAVAAVHLGDEFRQPQGRDPLIVNDAAVEVGKVLESKVVDPCLGSTKRMRACSGVLVAAMHRMMFCISTDLPLPVLPAMSVCGA